jgi:hypothetical protein
MGLTTAFRDYVCTKVTAGTGALYDPTTGHLGVGDGTAAFGSGQIDLQGTNKTRQQCSSCGAAANVITAVATFGSAAANHAWQEMALFNASSAGTMMQRVVSNQGTKASGSWQLTLSITITVPAT